MSAKITRKGILKIGLLGVLLLAITCKKDGLSGSRIPLEVTSFFPNSGKGLTLVTIEGQGFNDDYPENKVTFNGITADVVSVTAGELVVRAPEDGSTGMVRLDVGGSAVDIGVFTYQDLSITEVFPLRAAPGNVVTIRGYGFTGVYSPPVVTLNDSAAKIVLHSDTLIRAVVPAQGAGKGLVKLTIGDKQVTGGAFSYFKLLDFEPKFAFIGESDGMEVTFSGTGFNPSIDGNRVVFSTNGSDPAFGADTLEIISASEEQIVAKIPDGLTSSPWVYLESEGIEGRVSLTGFPQFQLLPKPQINSVSSYGGNLSILGEGLASIDGTAKVFIGDYEVPARYVTVYNVFFIQVAIHEGMSSGIVKVIANGFSAEGEYVTIN